MQQVIWFLGGFWAGFLVCMQVWAWHAGRERLREELRRNHELRGVLRVTKLK